MHNLTFTERARAARAANNFELAEAYDHCADYEETIEQLETARDALRRCVVEMGQASKLVECYDFDEALSWAREVLMQD